MGVRFGLDGLCGWMDGWCTASEVLNSVIIFARQVGTLSVSQSVYPYVP